MNDRLGAVCEALAAEAEGDARGQRWPPVAVVPRKKNRAIRERWPRRGSATAMQPGTYRCVTRVHKACVSSR